GPRFEHHYAERLVAAGHAEQIGALEQVDQGAVGAHRTKKAYGVVHPELARAPLKLFAHVTVAREDDLGVAAVAQNAGNGIEQQIGSLLRAEAPDEEHHRVERSDAVTGAACSSVDVAVEA